MIHQHVADHAMEFNHDIDQNGVRVVDQHMSWYPRWFLESWHIKAPKSCMNKNLGKCREPLHMNIAKLCFISFSLLLASERSERDTYRGNTIENRGCLFCVSYVVDPVPNCTKQNPLVYRPVPVSP